MSHVVCHVSCVTCHMSHVTFFSFFFLTKWWSFLVEGLLSTGPTPFSLFVKAKWNYLTPLCNKLMACFLVTINTTQWSLHVVKSIEENPELISTQGGGGCYLKVNTFLNSQFNWPQSVRFCQKCCTNSIKFCSVIEDTDSYWITANAHQKIIQTGKIELRPGNTCRVF